MPSEVTADGGQTRQTRLDGQMAVPLARRGGARRSAGETGLSNGGEQRRVGQVDPAVFDGEAIVGVEGVHPRGEVRVVADGPGRGGAVDLDRVLDADGTSRSRGAGEHGGREVVTEHDKPGAVEGGTGDGGAPRAP